MAFTIANVSHPNQNVMEGEFLGMKCKVLDFTFDNSYDNTNGESFTAASIGYQNIYGVIVMNQSYDATSKLSQIVIPIIASNKQSAVLRCFRYDGANAGKANFEQTANAVDLSAQTVRLAVIGA